MWLRLAGGRLHLERSLLRRLPYRCFTSSRLVSEQQEKKKGIPYSELTVGIPKETFPLEKRVAATPESVKSLIKPGFSVQIEQGAGANSYFSDKDYQEAGASIVDNVWKGSDIVLKVSRSSIPILISEFCVSL